MNIHKAYNYDHNKYTIKHLNRQFSLYEAHITVHTPPNCTAAIQPELVWVQIQTVRRI